MWVESRGRFGLVALAALFGVAFPGLAAAVEEPEYEVVATHGDVEVRRYAPMILAETRVDADFEDAGNRAFQRLFKYISGNNTARAKIDMTAPVVQESSSQKIEMTAPVVQESDGSQWRIAFVVPDEFSWETVPQPTDSRVELRLVPERTMAVIRFSGGWGEQRFEDHEQQLREVLRRHGLEVVGEAVYARYDPPFKPWFMRRNEVMIPVAPIVDQL
jgi:hypothetical protein